MTYSKASPQSTLTVEWNVLSPAEWAGRLARVPRSNLLQTFAYGRAIRLTEQRMPRFGLIKDGDEEVGLIQIQEARLLGVHTLVLDRGPLWLEGQESVARWGAFWQWFARVFPNRFLRFRRVLPEMPEGPAARRQLEGAGLKQSVPGQIGHRSIWIDVGTDEAKRRKELSKGWRSSLAKAERSGLTFQVDQTGRDLDWIIHQYAADKAERKYPGPSPKFVQLLGRSLVETSQCFVFRALKEARPVSGILVLAHGRSATYQIGWTGPAGRDLGGHHFLLWHALAFLADKGIADLDLGGINPEQAAGVTKFKKAMGGRRYELVPIFN